MSSNDLHREILPQRQPPVDGLVSQKLVNVANRTTRRSFLATLGRASTALLGAGFIGLWRLESAEAVQCSGGTDRGWSPRLTCMCEEVVAGGNTCPNCCGGFWIACPDNINNPANCLVPCHLNPPLRQAYKVRLYDCCAKCSGADTQNKAGCSDFGDDYCHNVGYCNSPAGICGPGSDGWRVKCVYRSCTNTKCGTIYQTCN
ncbi:MAG: hypothetical protein H0U16_12120 [Actinobacteria bacterium]|nr:hypothetical protein [Actinomycetota bacterium]